METISNIVKRDSWWMTLFITLVVTFMFEKQISAIIFFRSAGTLGEISFGFGSYVHSLISTGKYASCTISYCDYATRMPLLPFLMSAIGYFWDSQIVGALVKNLLVSAAFLWGLIMLARYHCEESRLYKAYCLVLAVMICSAPVIKHASYVSYEEGYILEFIVMWCFFFFLSAKNLLLKNSQSAQVKAKVVSLTLLIAFYIFMTKSSMLLIFLLSIFMAVGGIVALNTDRRSLYYIASSIVLCISLLFIWAKYQYTMTGHLSIMTTWDGENMFRGYNSASFSMYPDVNLDRVMDSDNVVLRNGTIIQIPETPRRKDFKSELEWNNYYLTISKNWLIKNPDLAAQFFLKKAINFFISVEKTPYSYTKNADVIDSSTVGKIENVFTTVWLLEGRIFEIMLLMVMIRLIIRGNVKEKIQAIVIIIMLGSYATPYLVGFNYERHITPFLMMISASLILISMNKDTPLFGNRFYL